MDVLIKNKGHPHLSLSPIYVDACDFNDSLVQSEEVFSNRRRGDVSIVDETNKIYILIENKLFSGEGEQQTIDYVTETKSRYPDYNRIYIFLTPDDGRYPEAEEFLAFSYSNLLQIIDDVLNSRKDEITDNAKFVISQFKRNIEVNILNESDIEQLCLKIYDTHKKAIDKIIDVKPSNKQIYDSLGQSVITELKKDWKYHATNSYCAIYREEWKTKHNPSSHFPFFHYEFNDVGINRIRIAFHIEGWGDNDLRELKNELKKTDFIKIKDVNITRGQVIVVRKSVNAIDNIDNAIKKSKDDMIKLIRDSVKFIDSASKSFRI